MSKLFSLNGNSAIKPWEFSKEEGKEGKCDRLLYSFNEYENMTTLSSVKYINENMQCCLISLAFFIQNKMQVNMWKFVRGNILID